MMRTCLADQVDADGVDDELCPLEGRGAVAHDIGCPVSDDVTLVQLALLVAGGAVTESTLIPRW
jgi:hypothetical protein